ncbi:MAG: hypothetical protein J5829_07500 [Lachnospiraceae bacterium]|nr:hypothetical protein [Lachnospiraceae bacterium]
MYDEEKMNDTGIDEENMELTEENLELNEENLHEASGGFSSGSPVYRKFCPRCGRLLATCTCPSRDLA